ncbi:hypothetical protein [Nostoc sp. 106C]|jgi:hypothetical protein|uniref:hypothetical protein n=1 Tax=Nostoc sp. 106C TaxID=1932667 RepID=UPI001AA138AC|nr:hypothetical protein [Nostoc sp. 106C]
MSQAGETKRQNFNVLPEQEAQIEWLRVAMGAATTKETILRSISVMAVLHNYLQQGYQIRLVTSGEQIHLVIPELEPTPQSIWQYLVSRPHPWRKQLYVKGRRLLASTVWQDMQLNTLSPEEAAENFSLPIAAVNEIIRYCEANHELIKMEAEEERYRLEQQGVRVESQAAS